jgi:hypothetical protein
MENVYDVIGRSNLHSQLNDSGGQYIIVGGLGLHAVTNAEKIDWGERVVTVGKTILICHDSVKMALFAT